MQNMAELAGKNSGFNGPAGDDICTATGP